MTYSPMPANHFTFDVLPSSKRIFAVATFAAACASRLSNHSLVWNRAIRANVFFHPNFHYHMVTFMLLRRKHYLGSSIGRLLAALALSIFNQSKPRRAFSSGKRVECTNPYPDTIGDSRR